MKFRKAAKKKEPSIPHMSKRAAKKMWDEVQKSLEEEYAGVPEVSPEFLSKDFEGQEMSPMTMHILPEESEQTEEDIEYLRQNVHRIFKRKV